MSWSTLILSTVRELSARGLSDSAIAVVLELYEGVELSGAAVQAGRQRYGIVKPAYAGRRMQAGAMAGPYIDPGQLRMGGIVDIEAT